MTNLPNVPYRSDTLKSNFERLVATLGPSTTRGIRELERLRDWSGETGRTATYCCVYFAAWLLGHTILAVCLFLTVLMCFPSTRRYLFPEVRVDQAIGCTPADFGPEETTAREARERDRSDEPERRRELDFSPVPGPTAHKKGASRGARI